MVIFDHAGKRSILTQLEAQAAQPGFWDEPKPAQEILQQMARLRGELRPWQELRCRTQELLELIALAEESEGSDKFDESESDDTAQLAAEIEHDTAALLADFERLHLATLFRGEYDHQNAIVSINSGAGGTEAADWAQMLSRMYTRWSQQFGYSVEVVEESPAEEAGLKSWTAIFKGANAYGRLRAERGVHRLVRLSPFDANRRRHTSFASVDVIPEGDETQHLEINPDELKFETYRSSGPGGQHAQKNETAVRITHVPTGLSAQSQSERSQTRNRQMALRVLEARLRVLMREQKQAELSKLRGVQRDIAWGSQIRSYVFHPYTLIKDHRTDFESSNIDEVMEGGIDGFIRAYLEMTSGGAG